jgi:hypothetical protein
MNRNYSIVINRSKKLFGKALLITPDLLLFLQLSTQTLKSVNLGYPSFNLFQFQPSV